MGICVSTSSRSTCSGSDSGEIVSGICNGDALCWKSRDGRSISSQSKLLHRLPHSANRIFSNGETQSSCLFSQQGRKGVNQDAMLVWEDFLLEKMTFCGIFDGHGPQGHLVAQRVRDVLPLKLLSFLHSCGFLQDYSEKPDSAGSDTESLTDTKMCSIWREAFVKSYKSMDKELRSSSNLDCFCSGSTAVILVKQGSNLFIGNIGDSRAILGLKNKDDDSIEALQLTVDLKPDLPREAERIKRCKGRVFALQDEPEVPRVWLPFDDAPGLAMARAFGDFCLKEYGVISIPEFSHRVLNKRDQFIVLASDGVWDVLSNEEVVGIVSSAPTRSSAAQLVVNSAARAWKILYPTSKMDDCAVICLFLEGKLDSEPAIHRPNVSAASSVTELDHGETNKTGPCLRRNFTVRSLGTGHIARIAGDGAGEWVGAEDQNWSGLEGVTRVNSLVRLPRLS